MALNVCPKCKEAILSFGDEVSIKCTKCETTFEVKSGVENYRDGRDASAS